MNYSSANVPVVFFLPDYDNLADSSFYKSPRLLSMYILCSQLFIEPVHNLNNVFTVLVRTKVLQAVVYFTKK